MNTTYRFHPGEYELGENEKFYGGMEARGWRLVERGGYLSKFTRTEPGRARYRIEVSSPRFMEDPALPEGQLAVFEDCGWEHICSRGFLHIFRAPEGSGAPEFYNDPAQQAETLKKVRRDLWWSVAVTALLLILVPAAALIGLDSSLGTLWARKLKRMILTPTVYTFYVFWLMRALYQQVWGMWKINRTYRRLKKGQPLDHNPKGNRVLHRLMSRGLLFLVLLSVLATAVQLCAARSEDLPREPDGPYVMLEDLGWTWERGSLYGDRESAVTYSRSPLTDYWETLEVQEKQTEGSTELRQVWMYQYVYRLRFPGMGEALARALMEDSVFAQSAERFQAIQVPGLDAAWTADMELVAVRGNLVAYAEVLATGSKAVDLEAVLAALAERWDAWEAASGGD